MIDPAVYGQRRAPLATLMPDGVALLRTAPERLRNRDSAFPFRFDSYFHYLTGFTEPEAVLVLSAGKLIFEGSPKDVTADHEVRRAYLGSYADARHSA